MAVPRRQRALSHRWSAFAAAAAVAAGVAAAPLPADNPAVHSDRFHCAPDAPSDPDFREAIAWVEFPRFGLLVPVYEGTREDELKRGAGFVVGTALPGLPDRRRNCVIAAHRTTYFSPLESAVPGDVVSLITGAGVEDYRIEKIVIVTPDHVELERPTKTPRLTLVTCTPFNYLGDAPKRFVVIASRLGGHPSRTASRSRAQKKGTPHRASPKTSPSASVQR
ncbi:MAG TPA: class D sortase [Thermoanaerobaculia bacterium]|nr:class D sortase [Thermoanaerobaculia bacterium]